MNRLLTADLHGTSEKRYDRLIFLRFFLRYIIILIVILSTIVPLFIRILRDQKAASIDEYERRTESVGRTITELLEAVEKRTIDIAWAYDVFLGDIDLSREIAARIAEFCNVTGSRQLSFDGLEGNMATGMGEYAESLFTKTWYDALSPELRGAVINDASGAGHYNWHVYTRMNWGEPWYAGFRESQTLYRLKNQQFFARNYLPHMLGWFALRPETGVEDIEWLLARAAGFDAGFALAMSFGSSAQQKTGERVEAEDERLSRILGAVALWERARFVGAFLEEIRSDLQDITKEFHLEAVGDSAWDLYPVHVQREKLSCGTNNEPRHSWSFRLVNPYAEAPLRFSVSIRGASAVGDLSVKSGSRELLRCRDPLRPGMTLKYLGGTRALICSEENVPRGSVDLGRPEPLAPPGESVWEICTAGDGSPYELVTELRITGPARRLQAVL